MAKIKALFKTRPIVYSIIIAIVAIGGIVYFVRSRNPNSGYQFISVTKGSITQEVTVTGNTTPISSVDMAFQNGGTISAVNYLQGAKVSAGNVVVALDASGLQAQLAQAQANVDAQQANLASLEAGATPADIQVSQTAVTSAEQILANDYMNISSASNQARSEANDAVLNLVAPLFTNNGGSDTSYPTLTFQVSDRNVQEAVIPQRVQSIVELNNWQTELQSINSNSSTSTLDTALSNAAAHLNIVQSFLSELTTAVNDSQGLSPNTSIYQTDVAKAASEVNTAITAINTLTQSIASQKTTVQQQIAALNLKISGPTQQAIQAQQAEVEQAMASVKNIQVSISNASLVAPISGVITVQNAKVGQIASPGEVLFSIISDNNLEVDSDVPEVDIGKVNVGDVVDMTLDAFQGKQFTGKVFYIDPAQTIVGGVVNYLVKVSFDQADFNVRSGLTANLNILTQTDNNALILPQYAVIQNSNGAFVEILKNGAVTQIPVTLGLQDQNGNIEIASGVTVGEQVLNIGLKQ